MKGKIIKKLEGTALYEVKFEDKTIVVALNTLTYLKDELIVGKEVMVIPCYSIVAIAE